LDWRKQHWVAPPRLDLSSICSSMPAACRLTQDSDFPVQSAAPVLPSAESEVQMQQPDGACFNSRADSDSDESNDSFDLFAPFKPAASTAASVEVELLGAAAAAKADSEEGETAPVQDWTESNSHDSDEMDAGDCLDGPPDSPAQQLESHHM
jgi:hypothetical protein